MARVLIVDDDRSVRRVLRTMFERAGHAVVEAESAAAALEVLHDANAPEAIVCDVMMPRMNGLEFYGRVLTEAPHLAQRVVFLTGSSHGPAVNQIEQLGVPLLAKLNDLQLVVDAVSIALLRPLRA